MFVFGDDVDAGGDGGSGAGGVCRPLSAALQCVLNPTAACITEHMFSMQEPERKGLFVIIHSFVGICSPPPPTPSPAQSLFQEHPNQSPRGNLTAGGGEG